MIELLFWSLMAVTWMAVGMHVAKEFVRFANREDNQNWYEKTQPIQKDSDDNCKRMEKGDGC